MKYIVYKNIRRIFGHLREHYFKELGNKDFDSFQEFLLHPVPDIQILYNGVWNFHSSDRINGNGIVFEVIGIFRTRMEVHYPGSMFWLMDSHIGGVGFQWHSYKELDDEIFKKEKLQEDLRLPKKN